MKKSDYYSAESDVKEKRLYRFMEVDEDANCFVEFASIGESDISSLVGRALIKLAQPMWNLPTYI